MARSKRSAKEKATCKTAETREATRIIHIDKKGKTWPRSKKIGNRETIAFKIKGTKKFASVVFLGSADNEFTKKAAAKVTVSAGRPSARLSPKKTNVTVDYEIKLGSLKAGPFSIQVGQGPLKLAIDGNGDVDLPYAAVPDSGTVIFHNQAGKVAQITFTGDKALFDGANPVSSPQDIRIGGDIGAFTGRGKNRKVKYHIDLLADAGISPRIEMLSAASGAARGNGTIKVGQT
jgi:hypothetical protein